MKKMNRKGFTIVELVIVIAVIAILAGVLIPTFSGIVDKAKESAILQQARNKYTEFVGMHDYTTGDPAQDLIIEVGKGNVAKDLKFVVVKDGTLQTKIYGTKTEAESAADTGAKFLCDEHNWKTPESGKSTCEDCSEEHTCVKGDENKCKTCGATMN